MADSTESSVELLFFDTFSHENIEELNLDLVQFPHPVIIYEVRVIPLRAQVQANLAGGVRLGATNPSAFKLELFVNNLTRPNAATFEKLGLLDYKENTNIQLKPEAEVPTDGLVLKGWYNTVTVAIYGCITSAKPAKASPPPPPPPRKVSDSRGHHEPSSAAMTEEELCKSAPSTQHPLDFIQHQLLQLQQKFPPQVSAGPSSSAPKPPSLQPSSTPSAQDIYKPFENLLQPHPPRDHHDQPPKRDFTFPPEPKEPYDARERSDRDSSGRGGGDPHHHEETRSRDSRDRDDWEYRRERRGSGDSRESRDYVGSREGSQDSRDFRDKDRDRSRYRDREEFEAERERERGREREREQWERERERELEREREREREREKELEREREREREREQREREKREREQREREQREREREQREREKREREQREREVWEQKRERERQEEQEKEREKAAVQKAKAWEPSKPRTPPMPEDRASPQRSQSRSRSRSPVVHDSRPPEPPMPPEEDMEVAEKAESAGPSGVGEVEMYEVLSENSPHVEVANVEREPPQEGEDGYEDISSDDELNDGEESEMIKVAKRRGKQQQTIEFTDDMTDDISFSTTMFNLQSYLVPLAMFRDPSLTAYEVEVCSQGQLTGDERQRPAEALGLLAIMEQFSKADHTEKWIIALEAIPPLLTKGLSYLIHVDKKKRVLDTLRDWALEGLSEDKAMQQPEATFKVRHLKMGVHLATALLSCEPSVSIVLLTAGVQSKLIDLLESKCMAFSVRLLILKALDASLRFPNGVRWFLGAHPQQAKPGSKDPPLTPYQRIVLLMTNKQLAQVMMGLSSLLHKAHIYQTFMKLRAAIDHVLDSLPSVEEEEGGSKGGGEGGDDGDEEDMDQGASVGATVEEEDVDTIVACLDEIYRLLVMPQHLISQPKSLLPVRSLSEKCDKAADTYPAFFRLAYHCRLLECLFVLLATGATVCQSSIFVSTRRILHTLLQWQEGLLFFSTRPDTTNGIIRSLVQMTDESCEESGEDIVARQLGLEMVYHLHTLQHVDQLLEYNKKVGDLLPVDDAEPLGILHSLYSMTFTPGLRDCVMARRAIAHVFGQANNFAALLPFVQSSGDEAKDAAQRKSVCWGYATQLISIIIAHAENTSIIEKFGARLLTICEANPTVSRLTQLAEWLSPVKKLGGFGMDEVGAMAAMLKTVAEDVSKLPPALVTLLRMLHGLALPPAYLADLAHELPAPLHHTYVIVELYSADCFPVLLNILQKLSEVQLKPWQQGVPQSLEHWTLFFSIVGPALAIVKATISLVIQARSSQFKDMTLLPIILELHTVVCSVPSSSLYSAEILKVQKDIVDILLAFTQPDFKTKGEEALSNSMWTLMMKEVIRYAVKSPYVYMSGLLLISELVPLPFPLLAKEPLEPEEISLAVNTRKLWSAHLHPLMPDIHSLISLLAGTGCQPLLCLLRRVCWQIADLAAPSATIIAKCLLDVYLEQKTLEQSGEEDKKEAGAAGAGGPEAPPGEKEKDGSKEEGGGGVVSPMTTKILSLISYLLSQPGIKSAILQLISAGSAEEKYKTLLGSLVQMMNQASPKPQHIQTQEAIMSVLQSLCDQEITLVAQDSTMSLPEQLACTLPDRELMSQIVCALLEHVGNPAHTYASLLPCVRTLVMLTEHDYGFYHLKTGLESCPGVLVGIMRHITATFSKDSSDCLSTLSTVLELLRLLTTADSLHAHADHQDPALTLSRTRILTRGQLAHFLEWSPNRRHPLQELEDLAKEEEALEPLAESIHVILTLLHGPQIHTSGGDQWEVTLPPSVPLLELFAQRSVYTLTDSDDDRLSASCWLANPAQEEPDAEPEVVRCDLLSWCRRHLPDLDIQQELKKEGDDRQEDIVRPKRPRDRRRSQEVININRGRPGRKPFVAPMRGRGIMAQGMAQRGGNDLFRSRPPNTSRPPSMHVDDFVKMENNRNQMAPPLQPTPAGPVLPRRDKDMPRGRGRGGMMDRGGRGGFSSGRGAFFSPPANYLRRDSNQHNPHNIHLFPAPPMLDSHRPKQNFPGPRQFPHDTGHPVGGLLARHDVRDNRFSPRGGRGPWFGAQAKDMGPGVSLNRRFMRGGGGGGGFHGRREPDNRHQRSFTK